MTKPRDSRKSEPLAEICYAGHQVVAEVTNSALEHPDMPPSSFASGIS
jgi:hypothetical protein